MGKQDEQYLKTAVSAVSIFASSRRAKRSFFPENRLELSTSQIKNYQTNPFQFLATPCPPTTYNTTVQNLQKNEPIFSTFKPGVLKLNPSVSSHRSA